MTKNQLGLAVDYYRDLRNGVRHPDGAYDNLGCFRGRVKLECCKGIQAYNELSHARSATHVATYYHVDKIELVREAKRQDAEARGSHDITAEHQHT